MRSETKVSELEKQLEKLQVEYRHLQRELQVKEEYLAELKAVTSNMEQEIDRLKVDVHRLEQIRAIIGKIPYARPVSRFVAKGIFRQ